MCKIGYHLVIGHERICKSGDIKTSEVKDHYIDVSDGYPMIAGKNPITAAYIYTIAGNNLVPYGKGRFHYERGPYVKNIVKKTVQVLH